MDPFLVESATTLAQLILLVLAGLCAIVGVRWAIRGHRSGFQVMDADDLEAAAARAAAAESTVPDATEEDASSEAGAPSEDLSGEGPGDGGGERVPDSAAIPDEPATAPVEGENILTLSLFGPDGAIPSGSLTPNRDQSVDEAPLEETPPEDIELLSEALFGVAGPLPSGSLEPVGSRFVIKADQEVGEPLTGTEPGRDPGPAATAKPPPPLVPGAGRFNLLADLPDFLGARLSWPRCDIISCRLQEPPAGRRCRSAAWQAWSGVGKTALGLHLAHELAAEGRFPDAQLYIDLKGSSRAPLPPAAALEALLTTLLGPDAQRPHDEDTLAHLWRAALQDRRVLLVLDDAAGSAQVRPLLPGSPTCAVLITSQQRFALPGAGRLDLEPLEPEDARAFLQNLVPRLEDAEAYQIARQCGGLPLALRIAGNYLALNDDLSPVVHAAHLAGEDTRLDLLRDPGGPDLDVGSTLASSIDRLSESMRRSWTMLAYLPAPFDVSAAAAVWGQGATEGTWERLDVGEALDRLRALRNSSLLTYSSQTGRYGQQVLLRLAASRELARLGAVASSSGRQMRGSEPAAWQDLTEGARLRVGHHFLEVARSADEDKRYGELDLDWPHLRAALEYARQLDADLFSELVQVLNNYWSARGMAREQVVWNDLAAKGSSRAGRQDIEGIHLGALGAAYDELGEPQQAIEAYGRAIRASRASGDQDGEASHLRGVGLAYQELGDTERAMHYYQQSLDLNREKGNVPGEASALACLGHAHAEQGDYRRAVGCYQQAVGLAQEIGDRQAEGAWLGALARCYAELGDVHQAIDTSERALAIVRASGNRREEAALLVTLGEAYAQVDQGAATRDEAGGQSRVDAARTWDGVGFDGPTAEGRAWGEEVELTPIRQILVPALRGIEVWVETPFPPDLDLADIVVQQPAAEGPGDVAARCGDDGDVDLFVQDIWATRPPTYAGEVGDPCLSHQESGDGLNLPAFLHSDVVRRHPDPYLVRGWVGSGANGRRQGAGQGGGTWQPSDQGSG